MSVEGPSEAKVNCADNNNNGCCTVEYLPTKAGIYDIVIKFAEKSIPGRRNLLSVSLSVFVSLSLFYCRSQNVSGLKFLLWFCLEGSPFHVEIVDEIDPSRVRCYGPGVESKGVRKGQPGSFTIDASLAGPGTPEVTATDHRGKKSSSAEALFFSYWDFFILFDAIPFEVDRVLGFYLMSEKCI